ncbi:DC-STAMP domain-containing protein 2 isoform X3 [Hemicordylus capensis]|uniref:DC-STAMP domain-containing protein 2 isoform X3 n=1 Tax=Hemicordylus capensis TaxID=884348 RepID=UPI002302193D|nr:DC-STAMP domain-containing protein 2 isoform X3 [Hemicordylus capensis]
MSLLSRFSPQQLKEAWQKKAHRKPKRKRKDPRVAEDTPGRAAARSLGGFVLGMTLAGAYGAMVLLVQGYNIWYCLVSTISLAMGLGLGLAFSRKARLTVALMLPQIFSREGKTMLLLLAFGLAMEGPFANIIRNFSRATESVSCGAELALNQTAEMLQRARQPLLNALQKIKDIARKAKVVGDRVRKLFRSVTDSVRHVAHCLRNVWYWLLHLGDVCNEEMGSPYRKCNRLFDSAKEKCEQALPWIYWVCSIVLLFKYLCGLANILLVFCVIPQYIVPFLKRKVADPIVNVLNRVRQEFEFNITTIHKFDVTVNASKSLSQVAFDIMEDVSLRLQPAKEAIGFFGYMSTLVILYLYLRALLYRKHYLHEDGFDNIYITRPFLEMDALQRKLKRPTVLPLSSRESSRYLRPASFVLPRKEQLRYSLAIISICKQLILVTLLIVADYSVFWLFDLVRFQLHGEIVARGIMYGTCFFIAVFGTYIQRLRRVICAWYYPSRERERICYLYHTILTRRSGLAAAVLKAVRQRSADGGRKNILLVFASKLPFCAFLAKKLGVHESYCMGCGKIRDSAASEDYVTCSTPNCRGIYCTECYKLLKNICSICMAPLTYQGEMDEEMDSSDEEAMALWTGAVRALRGARDEERRWQRQALKRQIERAVRGQGDCRSLPPVLAKKVLAQLKEEEEEEEEDDDEESSTSSERETPTSSAEESSSSLESSSSSLDFSYQKRTEGSDSEESSPESEELKEVKTEKSPTPET